MAREMFLEALQAYFAPTAALVIFAIILHTDKLFTHYIKRMFFIETAVIAVIIFATWADRCFSVMQLGGAAWRLRTLTTFLNFALSPLSPMILGLIYNKNGETKINKSYYGFAVINILLCAVSIFSGWVFSINSQNEYSRGPLFFVPFLVSGFYLLSMLYFTVKQKNMPSRRFEAFYLIVVMVVTAVASILEVVFVIRFMIWSTTQMTVILYFLVLTTQKILYDSLTGTLSRVAFSKKLDNISQSKKEYTLAIIDMNNLKYINDNFGHSAGNDALISMASALLETKASSALLYRCAGDEFAIVDKGGTSEKLRKNLTKAQASCRAVQGQCVSFAFGISEYKQGDDLRSFVDAADKRMYEQKEQMKKKAGMQPAKQKPTNIFDTEWENENDGFY